MNDGSNAFIQKIAIFNRLAWLHKNHARWKCTQFHTRESDLEFRGRKLEKNFIFSPQLSRTGYLLLEGRLQTCSAAITSHAERLQLSKILPDRKERRAACLVIQ
jgi:hypothetical protein